MIILNCYRPPSGSIDAFLDHVYNVLDQVYNLSEFEIHLCGDCNVDYSLTTSSGYKKLKTLEVIYGLSQLIKSPTRYTSLSASTLDLIFTNCATSIYAAPHEINISDHEPLNLRQQYTREDFQADLNAHDWANFYADGDVDSMWEGMEKVILRIADLHCPYKTYNDGVAISPWINQVLLELIQDHDSLYRLAKQTNDKDDWIKARKARNACNKGALYQTTIRHSRETS